jgi:hypothetical protein
MGMNKFTNTATLMLAFFTTGVSAQQCVRDAWGQVFCQQGYQVDSWAQQRQDQQVDRWFQQQEQDRQQRQQQQFQQERQQYIDSINQEANRLQQNFCRRNGNSTFGC